MNSLPPLFLERLQSILPPEYLDTALKTFSSPSPLSVRINTLKVATDQLFHHLNKDRLSYSRVPWYQEALIINATQEQLARTDLVQNNYVYPQGLSSMLPVVILDPQPGEKVLDMCAAPGSKTTQIASHMKNQGSILAVEAIRGRFYRLKSVVSSLGATSVSFKLMDARRLKPEGGSFDRILIDSPCSSEGRFKSFHPKSYAYWSLRKIKEMVRKQRGLLLTAGRLLKTGGTMVFATCTFAPEENEGVMDFFLKKTKESFKVESISIEGIKTSPVLLNWHGKKFHKALGNCIRILPTESMEGFFIAKLMKCD